MLILLYLNVIFLQSTEEEVNMRPDTERIKKSEELPYLEGDPSGFVHHGTNTGELPWTKDH